MDEKGSAAAHPEVSTLQAMLDAGVHFGHRASRWSPKMQPYIHGLKGSVHVINVERTLEKLKEAEAFVEAIARKGGTVLFVGTKPSAKEIVEREAVRAGMPFMVNRWLGGLLTNFKSLSERLKYFLDLEGKRQRGELEKYTKKERLAFDKELAELEVKFGGVRQLVKTPDALYIVDVTHEETAAREARRIKMPTVAIIDTNADPTSVTHPVPGNDDAISSIGFITVRIADAILRGKAAALRQE